MEQETQNPVAAPTEPEKKPGKNKFVIAIVLIVVVIAAGYYAYNNLQKGDVVAIVDGEKIYQSEIDANIERIQENLALQGVDLNSPEVQAEIERQSFQVLIDNTLLLAAAEREGLSASSEEVEAKRQELVAQMGGEEAFETQLESIGVSDAELNQSLTEQVLITEYIELATDIEELTVSEQEITSFMAENVGNAEGIDMAALEAFRPQIEQAILAEKQQEILDELLTTLREEADIEELI